MRFPPSGVNEVIACYGDPLPYVDRKEDWERNVLEYFELPYALSYLGQPVKRIRAHRKAGLFFIAAFTSIAAAGLEEHATDYGGIYNYRAVAGARKLSTHTWGVSIDLNVASNARGTKGTMHPGVIEAFKRFGFEWGGNWNNPDPMHFQLCRGY